MSILWEKDLSVGDATIDAHHQKLLEQINVLLTALISNNTKNVIAGIMEALNGYIANHLHHEEQYMIAHKFPKRVEHIKIHNEFREKYQIFKNDLQNVDYAGLAIEVQDFLGQWWVNHIGTVDKEYHDFIKKNPKSHPENEKKNYHSIVHKMV